MKNGIGLFLFLLCFDSSAGSTGVLYLMGRVPASYEVKMEKQGSHIVPVVYSNRARIIPRVSLSTVKNLNYVSVVHP